MDAAFYGCPFSLNRCSPKKYAHATESTDICHAMSHTILSPFFEEKTTAPTSGLIDFSALRQFKAQLPFSEFSVKYVVEGVEHYTVNGRPYTLGAGQYLLANHFSEGFAEINSPRLTVRGICLQLDVALISEAVASHLRPDTPFPDADLDKYFASPAFFENCWVAEQTNAGQYLKHLENAHCPQNFGVKPLSNAWSFAFAERIVADHVPIVRQLQSIPSVKASTRKDLLRRIHQGKTFLDEHFREPIDIASVARAAQLSEFHFFRLFKAAYKQSPYKYALQLRLQYALTLLQKNKGNVAEVAMIAGFRMQPCFQKRLKNTSERLPRP